MLGRAVVRPGFLTSLGADWPALRVSGVDWWWPGRRRSRRRTAALKWPYRLRGAVSRGAPLPPISPGIKSLYPGALKPNRGGASGAQRVAKLIRSRPGQSAPGTRRRAERRPARDRARGDPPTAAAARLISQPPRSASNGEWLALKTGGGPQWLCGGPPGSMMFGLQEGGLHQTRAPVSSLKEEPLSSRSWIQPAIGVDQTPRWVRAAC